MTLWILLSEDFTWRNEIRFLKESSSNQTTMNASSKIGNILVQSHRCSLLTNSLINFKDNFDFEVSLRLELRFYRSNSLILFCSPLHVHFILWSTCCYLLFLRSNWKNSQQILFEGLQLWIAVINIMISMFCITMKICI